MDSTAADELVGGLKHRYVASAYLSNLSSSGEGIIMLLSGAVLSNLILESRPLLSMF